MSELGYFTHAKCHAHDMGAGHPECPQRLAAIEDQLLMSGVMNVLHAFEVPLVDEVDILRAHEQTHWTRLQALGAQARSDNGVVTVDEDTAMNPDSLEAAQRAAGAAVAAVDAVLAGDCRSAFCAVRPPGHHATASQAMGFCLLNNVAIAAKHALASGLTRVAIVDFDVHHGNGTEDIVAGDPGILMLGFYQHPFYPHGGAQSDASNLLNLPVPAYTRGEAIRALIEQHWWPRLQAFDPELILISAGFDAHREDDLGQLGLVEADYAWMTRYLVNETTAGRQGRLVSCLEGGYNLSALARSVVAHVRELAEIAA